jgi:septum formation protein
MTNIPLILASSSPRRLELLSRIGIIPNQILPADIDESEQKQELPRNLVSRLAKAKAEKIASEVDKAYIIGADTVTALGRRILPKALNDDDVRFCLNLLSGKRHQVYTGITIIKKNGSETLERNRLVQSIVRFKRITDQEIELYVQSKEGINKAGGCSIQGLVESFIPFISGSHSNILGLPLFETRNMLISLGFFNQ